MISFASTEWHHIKSRGWVAMTVCDRERPRDNTGLTGKAVLIDGEKYTVRGVERRLPEWPIAKGEPIGLLVDGDPPKTEKEMI